MVGIGFRSTASAAESTVSAREVQGVPFVLPCTTNSSSQSVVKLGLVPQSGVPLSSIAILRHMTHGCAALASKGDRVSAEPASKDATVVVSAGATFISH